MEKVSRAIHGIVQNIRHSVLFVRKYETPYK